MSRTIIIDINPGMAIVGVLPAAQLSTAYNFTFTGVGGQGGYTFTTSSTLPGTFALASDGTLSGQSDDAGNFPITVTMRDVLGRAVTGTFNLRVTVLPIAASGTFPDGMVGVAYSEQIVISGGIAPHSLNTISKPPWMTLSLVGNTITASASSPLAYNNLLAFIVTDSDNASVTVSQQIAFVVPLGDELVIAGALEGNVNFPVIFRGEYA